MREQLVDRPFQVVLIASFQFLKASILIGVSALVWLAPNSLPHSMVFNQMLFLAAHGRDLSGVLVPIFGLYMAYVGSGIYMMRPSVRRTLAVSSAITIAISLHRLGLFNDTMIYDPLDRQTLYILILLDFAIYVYLVFHPEIVRTFETKKAAAPLHS